MSANEMRSTAMTLIAQASNYGPATEARSNVLAEAQVWASLAVSAEIREQADWFYARQS